MDMDFVQVIWNDAASCNSGWHVKDDLLKRAILLKTETCGHLAYEDNEKVCICLNRTYPPEDCDQTFSDWITIPRGMILEINHLEISNKKTEVIDEHKDN